MFPHRRGHNLYLIGPSILPPGMNSQFTCGSCTCSGYLKTPKLCLTAVIAASDSGQLLSTFRHPYRCSNRQTQAFPCLRHSRDPAEACRYKQPGSLRTNTPNLYRCPSSVPDSCSIFRAAGPIIFFMGHERDPCTSSAKISVIFWSQEPVPKSSPSRIGHAALDFYFEFRLRFGFVRFHLYIVLSISYNVDMLV